MWYSTNREKIGNQREITQCIFIDLTCLLIHVVWMILFFYESIFLLGALNAVSCTIYIYMHFTIRKGQFTRTIVLFYSEVLIHSIAALLCLGFTGGFDLYILIFIPVMFFYSFVYAKAQKMLSFGGVMAGVVYIVLKVIMYYREPIYTFNDKSVELGVIIFNCTMCIASLLIITFITCQEINQNRHELEEKNKKLTFLSCHDPLTKLLNRRSMEEIIDKVEIKAYSMGSNAVAFFDVDNFKRFNDQYGHECGDAVLVKVAEIISKGIVVDDEDDNRSEFACRWGGEEMVILFHNWDREFVIHRVTQIKNNIQNLRLNYGGEEISISVTCGLAFGLEDKGFRNLINEADAYMLKGKKNGKNCIVQG